MIKTSPQKEAATRNFTAAARAYDEYAHVQKESARDLLEYTLPCRPERILEPGCGTGIYTGLLLGAFPEADLHCVDIAPTMLKAARAKFAFQAQFVEADAEYFSDEPFDLITSNATFQWFNNLDDTLQRYRQMLRSGGRLTFSFYGPETYRELDRALSEATDGEHRVLATDFASKMRIINLLDNHFSECSVEERRYQDSFASLNDLLRTIKYTGVRGHSEELSPQWTPHIFAETRRMYHELFEDIHATYQVFLCRGEA